MRKACLSILLLLALTLPAAARKVRGTVDGGGVPLQNVIVTDGYRFTETDKNGRFRLNTHPDARYVAVVTPRGYVADFSSSSPEFYQSLAGKKRFDFHLDRTSDSPDYTLFSISDPQMQNTKHLKRFKDAPLRDLQEQAAKYSAERTTVAIALGDVAWNILTMHNEYKDAVATTGIPFYTVIGNHDFIQNLDGIPAGSLYEHHFGPYNYAFFLGDDLVIGLNNIIFKGNGTDDAEKSSNNYGEGYGKETLDFVEGLLKYVDKGTHLFIAQHSPVKYFNETGPILGADRLLKMLEGYEVDFLSGHTHTMLNTTLAPGIIDHNAGAIGGAWWATPWCRDGTPRGYEIITETGGERVWTWHSIDYPDDFQVEWLQGTDENPDVCIANVWDYGEGWEVDWSEDGVPQGPAEQIPFISPTYTKQIMDVYKGDFEKIPGYKRPTPNIHYFAAKPSAEARKVTITVRNPYGGSWEHDFVIKSDD